MHIRALHTPLFLLLVTGCAADRAEHPCGPEEVLNDLGFCVAVPESDQTVDDDSDRGDGKPETFEEPEWSDGTDCESQYAQLCYDGDVYWYDSCGEREDRTESCTSDEACVQTGPVDAECQQTEDPCTPQDHKVCVGDDVVWVDSCGVTGNLVDGCADACLEGNGTATCADLEFRCWDSDDTCYSASENLSVDIDCEVRTLGDEAITLTDFEIWARYSSDQNDIEEWDDDDWSGTLTLSPSSWTTVPDTFNVDFNDNLGDEELELEGSLTASLGDDSATFSSVDAESSEIVQVLDSWICW